MRQTEQRNMLQIEQRAVARNNELLREDSFDRSSASSVAAAQRPNIVHDATRFSN
jgi:hypothetical protein